MCKLCPNDDMNYSDRVNAMRMFGPDADCATMSHYLGNYVNENDQRCELAHMFNYICGCKGSGYLGANTHGKRTALEWLPRVMALLSFLVSTNIIYMLVPKCALSQFANWDPSLRTEIHLSQFAHWAPVPKLGSQFAH